MSAYNLVKAEILCPVCHRQTKAEFQFKYADVWQHEYLIGDKLKWGGNDIGSRDFPKVLVSGIGGPCIHCNTDGIQCEILVVDNKIKEVKSVKTGNEKIVQDSFVVLEE